MDMQKDSIHIDDVFRRVAGGEEQEGSGAWSRMKDILDEEMPVGGAIPHAARSYRRFLPLLLVLLMAGGVASYYYSDSNSTTPIPDAADNNTLLASSAASSTKTSKYNGVPALPQPMSTQDMTSGSPAANQKNTESQHKSSSAEKGSHTAGEQTGTMYAAATSRPEATNARTPAAQPQPAPIQGAQTVSDPVARQDEPHHSPAPTVIEHQQVIELLQPLATANKGLTSNQLHTVVPAAPLMKPVLMMGQHPVVQSASGAFYKEERDTFTEVSIARHFEPAVAGSVQRPSQPVRVVEDTLAVKRVERVRYVPLNKMEIVQLQELHLDLRTTVAVIEPARLHNSTYTTSEAVAMVPLSRYMVKSKKMDKQGLNNLLQQTSNSLASYFDGSQKFYMGLLVGGNLSIGNPAGFGMQLGLAGLYSLSERVVLSAELRFKNHYYSNYTVADTRTTYDVSSSQLPGGAWLFSGKEYTATSNYRIDHFNSLELPLMVNYSLGRMAIYGGPSLNYAFPMQWGRSQSFSERVIEQQHTTQESPFENTAFHVDPERDFKARMGIGFVTGLTYDFSRTISLDARMSKPLWNNNAAAHGINRLYTNPSLQLSIGYYFGRRDKVVYMMKR